MNPNAAVTRHLLTRRRQRRSVQSKEKRINSIGCNWPNSIVCDGQVGRSHHSARKCQELAISVPHFPIEKMTIEEKMSIEKAKYNTNPFDLIMTGWDFFFLFLIFLARARELAATVRSKLMIQWSKRSWGDMNRPVAALRLLACSVVLEITKLRRAGDVYI